MKFVLSTLSLAITLSLNAHASDHDSDGDSINDDVDNCINISNEFQWDKDQDNIGNECDEDIDGDGFSNNEELSAGTKVWDKTSFPISLGRGGASNDDIIDTDGDGIADEQDNCSSIYNKGQWDKDKDGIGNECDQDVDGDGFANITEEKVGTNAWNENDKLNSHFDIDGDGIFDHLDNCIDASNPSQWDNDGDGIGNKCDDDVDGDGYSNLAEIQQNTQVWSKTSSPDLDSDIDDDNIPEHLDNCITKFNPEQWDKDNDGQGNECDQDIDGDGFSNRAEELSGTEIWQAEAFPIGEDGDQDGFIDELDNCPNTINYGQYDKDNDGIGNLCDDDIDGDGYPNAIESIAKSKIWNIASVPTAEDNDKDMLPVWWEAHYQLQDNNPDDSLSDVDGDGLSNLEEFYLNFNPLEANVLNATATWSNSQGNDGHNNFVLSKIDIQGISDLWEVELDDLFHPPVSTAEAIYLSSQTEAHQQSVQKRDSKNGQVIWQTEIDEAMALSKLVYGNSSLVVTATTPETGKLLSINIDTGEQASLSDIESSAVSSLTPSTFGKDIILDKQNEWSSFTYQGEAKFNKTLAFNNHVKPLVTNNYIALCNDENLAVYNRNNGYITRLLNKEKVEGWAGCLENSTLVAITPNSLISQSTSSPHQLQYINFKDLELNWSLATSQQTSTAYAFGKLYYMNGSNLTTVNVESGEILWQLSLPGESFSNMVLTRNLLFISNEEKTLAVDLENESLSSWQKGVSGSLSFSGNNLYISNNEKLVALKTDNFVAPTPPPVTPIPDPIIEPEPVVLDNFENNTLSDNWVNADSSSAWSISNQNSSEGSFSLSSASLDNHQESSIEYSSDFKAGTLEYKTSVDSTSCCAQLEIYVDDEIYIQTRMNNWNSYSIDIPEGQHTVRFTYRKKDCGAANDDKAWIDDIQFTEN